MRRCAIWLVLLTVISGCSLSSPGRPGTSKVQHGSNSLREVLFPTEDHRTVYGDWAIGGARQAERVVVMFHQAGSNAGEYETIIPSIEKLGFDCLAIDQRSGGDRWGRLNRTVNRSGSGSYLDAYKDIEAAIKYAKRKGYKSIFAWGSSYSASLVLRLASVEKGLQGILVFSPGEYLDDKAIVSQWSHSVNLPVLFACTPDEWSDGRSELFDAIASKDKEAVELPGGVHGSSTLIPDHSTVATVYLAKVTSFLLRVSKGNRGRKGSL